MSAFLFCVVDSPFINVQEAFFAKQLSHTAKHLAMYFIRYTALDF
jgi:hypothetical protein